jgi:hypothetical protein
MAREHRIDFVSGADWESFAVDAQGQPTQSTGKAIEVKSAPADLAAIPGARWIWRGDSSPDGLADMQAVAFEKTFSLGPNPAGVFLIAADDFAEVLINGSVIGCTGSTVDIGLALRAQSALLTLDATPYLKEGTNTITIVAQNGPRGFAGCPTDCTYSSNPAGVVFGGTLSY